MRNLRNFFIFLFLLLFPILTPSGYAEVKIIEAESTYIIGDNDSKIDARRVAIQEAKRKALEAAGTYVESLSQVKNYQLTKDEVKSYTAGVMETEIVSEQMHGSTERPEITIKTRCKIDTDVLMKMIERYRDNEDLKEQLAASAKENDSLRKERDTLVTQLAAEKDRAKAEQTRNKLNTVLAREEANEEVRKVWTNYDLESSFGSGDTHTPQRTPAELDHDAATLQKAIQTDPRNRQARMVLASVYERKGDRPAAENQLRAALERDPSNLLLHLRLGVLLREEGEYEQALREFHFVEKRRPRNAAMLFYAGMTFHDLGRCGKAVSYLKRFLKYEGSNKSPKKREIAMATVKNCGGERWGARPERPGVRPAR